MLPTQARSAICSTVLFTLAALALPARAQVEWTPVPVLEGHPYPHMVWDSGSERLLLISPPPSTFSSPVEVWQWGGAQWGRLPTSPAPSLGRSSFSAVYDEQRDCTLVFGDNSFNQETWVLEGQQWTQLAPANSPPNRRLGAMVYDSQRDVVVLFGGLLVNSSLKYDDTWEWNGTDWVERFPVSRPAGRAFHGMVYDSARGRTVLFGGSSSAGPIADTWEWDGSEWFEVTTANSPAPRTGFGMTYDSLRRRTVLFGGAPASVGIQRLGDTWEWDGLTWTERSPLTLPPGREDHTLGFDPSTGRSVMFGGLISNTQGFAPSATWEWDGVDWISRGRTAPGDLELAALAYDAGRDVIVAFGGERNGVHDETWEWDGQRWEEIETALSPPPRSDASLTYDPVRERMVLFGGRSATAGQLADTWEWDGQAWTETTPAVSPSARRGHASSYDYATGSVLIHGGTSGVILGGTVHGDLWSWDGAAWTALPGGGPGRRFWHGMSLQGNGRVVLFGGQLLSESGLALDNTTWQWNGADWARLNPPVSPPPSLGAALTWDEGRGRLVLASGAPVGIWEFDGNSWLQRSFSANLRNSFGASMAYHLGGAHLLGLALEERLTGSSTWSYGPLDPARLDARGAGCSGAAGAPTLATAFGARPWLGDTLTFDVAPTPPGALALLMLGTSSTNWGAYALPLELSGFGMPGCTLYTSPDITRVLTPGAGGASGSFSMGTNPALVGLSFHAQAAVRDPSANAYGWVMTNALEGVIGSR